MFNCLFNSYKKALDNNITSSSIFKAFLNDMSEEYNKNTTSARKVIDFIAGMTDDYFLREYEIINK